MFVGGGSSPAVRVDLNPTILNQLGVSLEQVRSALANANANRPKGQISSGEQSWLISSTDQLFTAAEYESLILVFRNGAPVRLRDVATVTDSVQDIRAYGIANGRPSVNVIIYRQPGANIISTVDRIRAILPQLDAQIPTGIDLDVVVRDAHRELVGLGAFGPLLEDEEVGEIHCVRFDQLFTLRTGGMTPESTAFSSEEALQRVIGRLAQQAGEPWKPGETVIERRMARAAFVAIAPPAAAHHVVSIRKRRRIETSLEELTRSSSMSKPMAQFLEACVTARTNILVSGNTPLPVLSALAATGGSGERVVVVQDVEEIGVGNAHAASLSLGDTYRLGEECVRAAAKLRADRMIITQLAGGVAAATVDAMAEGNDGVLAALSAPTLRQGLGRLVAQLVLHRPGLSLEGMREVVGEAFDIAIETSSLPDGRLRVTRIAELGGADAKGIVVRDLFVFSPDASGGDGSFSATGVVPRLANELAARGMKLDPSLFKRAGR